MSGDGGGRREMEQPPRLARWLLHWSLPINNRDEVIGDLDEEYRRYTVSEQGSLRARLWYWRQAIGSMPRLIGRDAAQDLRYGLRTVRHHPGFTVAAIIMLALGIGATTAMFSVVNAVLIQPLPYNEPDKLVRLRPLRPGAEQHRLTFSQGEFLTYEERNASLAGLAAFEADSSATLASSGEPLQVTGARVTASLFDVLGVQPQFGRLFMPEEDRPDGPPVLMISHALWQQMFAGDIDIVGTTIDLDAVPTTIVAVMPPGFHFPDDNTNFWAPLALERVDINYQGGQVLQIVGRRLHDRTMEVVQEDLDRVSVQITEEALTRYPGMRALVSHLQDDLAQDVRPSLLLLLGVVGVVLVLVCFNIAGYLVAQGVARGRELTVRMALGASAGRIVRQLVSESSLLAIGGGLLGAALAVAGVRALNSLQPAFLDHVGAIELDVWVLTFALIATSGSILLFGLAPAWYAARAQAGGSLGSSRGARSSRQAQGFLSALVFVQIAACVVLLIGSGLMVQTLAREVSVDPGFAVDGLLTFRVALPSERYPDAPRVTSFYERALEEIRTLPFVQQAGAITRVPMGGSRSIGFAWQEGKPIEPNAFPQEINMRWAMPTYFEAMDIALLGGEVFDDSHVQGAPLVVVVSESLAQALWPGEDPVGKRFKLGRLVNDSTPWRTVLGVVEDVRHEGPRDDGAPTAYFAYKQRAPNAMSIVVRVADAGAPGAAIGPAAEDIVAGVRRAIARIDADQPIFDVQFMRQLVAGASSMTRYSTVLLGSFSALALLLATIGLYALIAYSIRQRFHEIGIRRALGATEAGIVRLVMSHAGRLTAVGIAAGIGGAFAMTRFLEGLVFGVTTTDPATFVATCTVVALIALVASLVPAWRATAIGPGEALR